jgi:hypothetical protein
VAVQHPQLPLITLLSLVEHLEDFLQAVAVERVGLKPQLVLPFQVVLQ